MNTNTIRSGAVAASYLLVAIACQSVALAQATSKSAAKPAPEKTPAAVPAPASSGVVSASGAPTTQPITPAVAQPLSQAAAQPPAASGAAAQPAVQNQPGVTGTTAATTAGQQAPSKPVGFSGPPPMVIGPSGRSTSGVSAVRVSISGAKPAPNFASTPSRTMRVGVSKIGDSPLIANASVSLDDSPNHPQSVIQIPLAAATGSANVAAGGDGSSIHTWTRDGSTLASAPGDSGAGTPATAPGSILAGSSITLSSQHSAVPFGVVNGMLTRSGGMGSVIGNRTAAVPGE